MKWPDQADMQTPLSISHAQPTIRPQVVGLSGTRRIQLSDQKDVRMATAW